MKINVNKAPVVLPLPIRAQHLSQMDQKLLSVTYLFFKMNPAYSRIMWISSRAFPSLQNTHSQPARYLLMGTLSSKHGMYLHGLLAACIQAHLFS